MRGQVGNWGGELSVALDTELIDWLDSFGTDRYLSLSGLLIEQFADLEGTKLMGRSRMIHVMPMRKCPEAFRVSVRPGNGVKHGLALPYHHVPGVERLRLPRFELHDVDFVYDPMSEAVVAYLQEDHQLPWPKLRTKCDLYSSREVMEEQLKIRMLSYLRHNPDARGRPAFLRPPQRLIDGMVPGAWKRIVDECKQECGVA